MVQNSHFRQHYDLSRRNVSLTAKRKTKKLSGPLQGYGLFAAKIRFRSQSRPHRLMEGQCLSQNGLFKYLKTSDSAPNWIEKML